MDVLGAYFILSESKVFFKRPCLCDFRKSSSLKANNAI